MPETLQTWDSSVGTGLKKAGGLEIVNFIFWLGFGTFWVIFSLYGWIYWALSPDFTPIPIAGPDTFSMGKLVGLRIFEAVCVIMLFHTVYQFLLKPWRKQGQLTMEGMLTIGAVFAFYNDVIINYYHYTFAWNNHAINFGSWAVAFPGHAEPTRYAEGLLWVIPSYVFYGVVVGWILFKGINWLMQRYNSISFVRALSIVFLGACLFDFISEFLMIRLEVYSLTRTHSFCTLWAGSQYQFPLYESFFMGLLPLGWTLVLASAEKNGGVSFVDRGAMILPSALRTPGRLIAVIGFCALWVFVTYFGPWAWLSRSADSFGYLPSYFSPWYR